MAQRIVANRAEVADNPAASARVVSVAARVFGIADPLTHPGDEMPSAALKRMLVSTATAALVATVDTLVAGDKVVVGVIVTSCLLLRTASLYSLT